MRLATCVALEAVVGVALLGGAAAGVWYGLDAARAYVDDLGPEAHASTIPARVIVAPIEAHLPADPAAPAVAVVPAAVAPAVAPPGSVELPVFATIFPKSDVELLAPLRAGEVTHTKVNRGGSSLSLRIELGGPETRAAFKPAQTASQSQPRREIAAYRMDRMLHIGRVPPCIGRTFAVDDLVAGFDDDKRRFGSGRIADEASPRKGQLAGSVSWWVPEIQNVRVNGFDIDSTDGIVTWRRYVRVGAKIPDENRWIAEQVSTMSLFDFVIDNIDRWSGGNVRIAPGGREIYFMDNTFSFTNDKLGHRKGQIYLERVEVFSRDLVTRLRALTEEHLHAVMDVDKGPFDVLLTDREIKATLARRDYAIAYIDRLIARHGEAAVLAFP